MNEQTTDTGEEVALPNFDWERMAEVAADDLCTPEEHPDHEACMACLAIKGTRWALSMRERLGKAEAANREKDAEIERLNQLDTVVLLWRAEKAEAELASLRASVGEKWIDVTQKLPAYGQLCIMFGSGVVQHALYSLDDLSGEWTPFDEDFDNAPFDTFTHWMPLPAPPTKDKE